MNPSRMSLMRAKPNRFSDVTERPSTAVTSGVRPIQNQQKSFIPKFRSLSQPPSISTIDPLPISPPNCDNNDMTSDNKNSLLDNEIFNDVNLMADDFKDCLESVKLELDTPSNTAFNNLNLGTETAEEILKNLEIPDDLDTSESQVLQKTSLHSMPTAPQRRSKLKSAAHSGPIRSLSRKNSNSGIPVSMSVPGKSPARTTPSVSPKPQARRIGAPSTPPTMLSGTKRQTTSPSAAMARNQSPSGTVKRNYDLFLVKKKRYDMLRKDMQDKQKPIIELYNTLQQLRRKLEDGGKQVIVEPMPFDLESEVGSKLAEDAAKPEKHDKLMQVEVMEGASGEANIDMKVLDDVKKSVEEIRLNSVELCKNMMEKRNDLLTAFENIASTDNNNSNNNGKLLEELEMHKSENAALDAFLKKTILEQENELRDMLGKLSQLSVTHSVPDEMSESLQERLQELKEYEKKTKTLEKELNDAHSQMKVLQERTSAGQDSGDALRSENDKLKHRITSLEKHIDTEKKKATHESDKFKISENNSKTLKLKIRDLENNKQLTENKISQLSQDLRTAQNKLKLNERNYEKELAELNKSRNLDKSVIERLNRDKSTFEARLNDVQQNAEAAKAEHEAKEQKLRHDMEFARQECDVQTNTVGQLKIECEKLKHELHNLRMHAKQTSEVIRRKDDSKANTAPITERECELQIELVAQRAAIKALQEKVDSNALEKIRFIETIEKMNGGSNDMCDDIVKALVSKEEEITQLHVVVKKKDEELMAKRIESRNLKAKVEHLNNHIDMLKQGDEHELKHIIKEGRTKLEDALLKSLENEHKMIKYEHDLAQKIQTVTKLENTVKLRDGLIGLLKTKKEELAMENKSLVKYSEEIRKFVLEAKEELQQKTEIVNELQLALSQKLNEVHKFEKYIQQLEGQLAITNEKRYKLQDTVSCMEKELQAAKAEPETRTGNKFLKPKGRWPSEN